MKKKQSILLIAALVTLIGMAPLAFSDFGFEGEYSCCGDALCDVLDANSSCAGSGDLCGKKQCCINHCNDPT